MGWRQAMPGVFRGDPAYDRDDSHDLSVRAKISNLPVRSRLTKRFCQWRENPGAGEGLTAALDFVNGRIRPPFLLLFGKPGLGKSHLAIAIGWHYLINGRTAAYYQAEDLLDTLREGYRPQQARANLDSSADSYDKVMKFAKKVDLLLLDDLGAHKGTDWAAAKLDQLINHRYTGGLATVITANTLEIPDRILDRCREGRVVRLRGESYRALKGQAILRQ
ncbi:MAG: ATP-binding protein [Chloroflexota bacterium]